MKIIFHRDFEKDYFKLSVETRKRSMERLSIFANDPFDVLLSNHALTGKYQGCRSIRLGGDLRAVYKLVREDVAFFIAVGTHAKLYKS